MAATKRLTRKTVASPERGEGKDPTFRSIFRTKSATFADAMGVEGRERDKTLDAGASVISGQLGKTVQRLRKAYNLSLSELSEQSGVAKSIISQIERNETNPTLATIWRLAQALDVSIERVLQAAEDEPFLEKSTRARHADPRLRRRQVPARHHRLDQDGRMAAMVRLLRRSRRRARIRRASARLGRVPLGARGRARSRRSPMSPSGPAPARRCATAATGRTSSATCRTSPAHATMVCILKAAVME